MPNVPYIANQNNLTNLPSVSVQAPGPDAFGAGLGADIQKASVNIGQALEQVRARKARVNITAAQADLASKQAAFMHGTVDPQTGAVVPGALSKQGLDASGVASAFAKQNQDWMTEYKSKLSSEEWAQFEPWAMERTGDGVSRMAEHEVVEGRKGEIESHLASSSTLYNVALRNYDKDKEYYKGVDDSANALASAMNVQGKRGADITDEVSKLRNKSAVDRVQSAIANKRYDMASAYAASDRLSPEQQGELAKRIESEREQENRLAKAQLDHDAAELAKAESAKLSKAFMDTDWNNPADRADFIERARTSPVPAVADAFWQRGMAMQARVEEEQKKTAEQLQKERADASYRRLFQSLQLGLHFGPNGEIVKHSPAESAAMIDQAYLMPGGLHLADRDRLLADVKKYSDQRIQDMTATALKDVVPEAAKYFVSKDNGTEWALDESGRPVVGKPGPGKPAYDSNTVLFSRRYDTGQKQLGGMLVTPNREIPPQFRSAVGPVSAEEEVSISNIQDAMRIVRDRMVVDPKMTPDAGVALLRDMVRPDKDRMAKSSLQRTMRDQALLIESMRQNLERQRLAKPVSK